MRPQTTQHVATMMVWRSDAGGPLQDPVRVAEHLLATANRWAATKRGLFDEHDRDYRRRGVTGARRLAVAILRELQRAGALAPEHVADLLTRHRQCGPLFGTKASRPPSPLSGLSRPAPPAGPACS